MNYRLETQPLESIESEAIVVLHARQGMSGSSSVEGLQKHIDFYKKSVEEKQSQAEWFCTLEADCESKSKHMLLHSVTFDPFSPGTEPIKTITALCVDICRRYSITKIAFAAQDELGFALLPSIFEGIFLGDFFDQRYKSNSAERKDLEITFVVSENKMERAEAALERLKPIVLAQNRARQLVNTPYHDLTPLDLAEHAQKIAYQHETVQYKIHSAEELRENGYGLISAIGDGASQEPCMIELKYEPQEPGIVPPAILIGKGVCFDSGGYSIKGRDKMHIMNADMAGGAAALEAFAALVELESARPLTLLIPAVINSVDAKAIFPGAILKAKNGKTIFIENTDAEGRLVLADALCRANEIITESQKDSQPQAVNVDQTSTFGTAQPMTAPLTGGTNQPILVTLATLTGAAGNALGDRMAALFTHDQELRNRFIECGMRTGDHVWPLPFWSEYQPTLFHPLADLSNLSSMGQSGGAIHAANFLQHFVPKGVRWAHIDMSRPARAVGRTRYFKPGGTGYGVRLVVEALTKA